jgi:glycerol-3-phosphate acyltransferase PlsY
LLILLSYVLGSVPTGVLAGRAWLARRRPVGSKG